VLHLIVQADRLLEVMRCGVEIAAGQQYGAQVRISDDLRCDSAVFPSESQEIPTQPNRVREVTTTEMGIHQPIEGRVQHVLAAASTWQIDGPFVGLGGLWHPMSLHGSECAAKRQLQVQLQSLALGQAMEQVEAGR
jgi:hypothetical protein